jgi:hypothetical protein
VLQLLLGLLIWPMVLLSWILLSVLIFGQTDFTFFLCVPRLGSGMRDQLVKNPSALGFPFLELLDDFTLLLVFLGPFGGL